MANVQREELLKKSTAFLKRKCKSCKISAEGRKGDLVNRLMHHMYGDVNGSASNHQRTSALSKIDKQRLALQRRMRYNPNKAKLCSYTKKNRKRSKLKAKRSKYLSFTFVGIFPDSGVGSIHTKFDNIEITSLKINSKLKSYSTVGDLIQFIKQIYSIPSNRDVLIIFSHSIISNNRSAKLRNFGITNHSLLTLAICAKKNKKNKFNPYDYKHLYNLLRVSPTHHMRRGLDIITQETDALLYKMPFCGHYMSKQSLYHYAASVFSDPSNLYLRCPHQLSNEIVEYKSNNEWSCPQCAFVVRNRRWSGMRDKCPMCGHSKPENASIANNKCNQMWHYSLIKQILLSSNDDDDDVKEEENQMLNLSKLELLSARNRLESKDLNVQKCHNCKTLHFKHSEHNLSIRNMDGYKQLRTKCVNCNRKFCWNCGKKYTKDHACDGSYILQIMTILETCPLKTIGYVDRVPSIRACVNRNCGQLITHITACKHMKCETCKCQFCFVCLKPMINGQWQCGGSADRCPVAERQTLQMASFATVHLKKSFQLF